MFHSTGLYAPSGENSSLETLSNKENVTFYVVVLLRKFAFQQKFETQLNHNKKCFVN
jgi:hypothetical protein